MAAFELNKGLLDHFKITECTEAKSGGQKAVYKVKIDEKHYALKIIKIPDERFEREVKICKEFSDHVGIPTIDNIVQFEGDTIIIEEYIDGDDLSEIATQFIGDEVMVVRLLSNIIHILKPVWESRYIHRDLKPPNIRVRKTGEPVILDFGIARALDDESITLTGGQPLTYLFGSPEQYAGKKALISYRTDFFCLGIIAFYLFTGKLPFGNNRVEIEKKYNDGILVVSTNNEKIDVFCNSVFKLNPSERPRTIESLLKLISL